jgi:hypothetical protein
MAGLLIKRGEGRHYPRKFSPNILVKMTGHINEAR